MSAPTTDPAHEFELLSATLDEFEELRCGLGDAAGHVAESVSGWSVEGHLYHLALATDLALGHVRSLLAGRGMLVREEGELATEAAEVLAGRRSERGVAEAPRMVRPPAVIEGEYLAQELERVRTGIGELLPRSAEIPAARGWIPHQALGTLRAEHWVRFAALHAVHHLAIARDVAAAASERPASAEAD